VETAESAEAAVQRLGAGPVDLLVLDWRLPGMSGLDLCKSLRARPALAALPILFLTGNTSSADMVEALASGADDYVVKPFRAAELGARIFALLRRARLGVAAPA
jgi:two-component system phosphate regulon response regulator PhoB